MTPLPSCGLYAITSPADTDPTRLVSRVSAAIRGGAAMIQYRPKDQTDDARYTAAALLLNACRARRVPMIVNDDPDLAAEIGADGVHVGHTDTKVRAARRRVGDRCIVGASCYDRLNLACAAVDDGATYVAFGSFFASPTKPHAVPAPMPLLTSARDKLKVPIVAIGGITADNGALLLEAGVTFLAAIDGVFSGDDVEPAARRYAELFA